jgi:hypothetical protein
MIEMTNTDVFQENESRLEKLYSDHCNSDFGLFEFKTDSICYIIAAANEFNDAELYCEDMMYGRERLRCPKIYIICHEESWKNMFSDFYNERKAEKETDTQLISILPEEVDKYDDITDIIKEQVKICYTPIPENEFNDYKAKIESERDGSLREYEDSSDGEFINKKVNEILECEKEMDEMERKRRKQIREEEKKNDDDDYEPEESSSSEADESIDDDSDEY